mmetsp:Transcript_13471/g.29208  ORF Transcript_13471/g.29208 Transcript_13471/m.29208 type:complete len:289 (+) Transcript_13471:88-954(+)|eukprot:CAMPEP_0185846504 /NCGR_PEP_ID=MMETSP1354-20130828/2113_1 /TAXON_ID=708628 /ORGANISM="Erythrolobus madagascarensis, Strain CCMP3276" /LENGTH=288 /DNA_ID=CAMNT_0028546641 /DNA_START=81 /DNA_END=947 /DNA_ORIENTATION=-
MQITRSKPGVLLLGIVLVGLTLSWLKPRLTGESTTVERADGKYEATSERPQPSWADFKEKNPPVQVDDATNDVYAAVMRKHSQILGFSDGGRQLVDNELRRIAKIKGEVVVLEVGVWFGRSAARWASVDPKVRVIGIDPFLTPHPRHSATQSMPEDMKNRFGVPEFNRGLAERVIRMRGVEPQVAFVTGFSPQDLVKPVFENPNAPVVDIIYIDGGKRPDYEAVRKYADESLAAFAKYAPNAILAGDDWSLKENRGIKDAVTEYVEKNPHLKLEVSGFTWIVLPKEQQ